MPPEPARSAKTAVFGVEPVDRAVERAVIVETDDDHVLITISELPTEIVKVQASLEPHAALALARILTEHVADAATRVASRITERTAASIRRVDL